MDAQVLQQTLKSQALVNTSVRGSTMTGHFGCCYSKQLLTFLLVFLNIFQNFRSILLLIRS